MSQEDLRQLVPLALASAVVLLGLLFLYLSRLEHDHDLEAIIAGFIGASLQYVFAGAISERAAKQARA